MSLNPFNGVLYSIQHYEIKFVSDLLQVCGFLCASVSSTNKTDCHDILVTDILLKVVVLSTVTIIPRKVTFSYRWLWNRDDRTDRFDCRFLSLILWQTLQSLFNNFKVYLGDQVLWLRKLKRTPRTLSHFRYFPLNDLGTKPHWLNDSGYCRWLID